MAELPSGTATFLFTDIERSTTLWERDRQAMATAVTRHMALLDAAIQAHGGIHFKTVGDAVQAAFPTANQEPNWFLIRMSVNAGVSPAAPRLRQRDTHYAAVLRPANELSTTGALRCQGGHVPLTDVPQAFLITPP
jgi:class 3 adenylate cyclase